MTEKQVLELIRKLEEGAPDEKTAAALRELFNDRNALKVFFLSITGGFWNQREDFAKSVRKQLIETGKASFIVDGEEYIVDDLLSPLSEEARERLFSETPYQNPMLDRDRFFEPLMENLSGDRLLNPEEMVPVIMRQGLYPYSLAIEDVLFEMAAVGEQMRAWQYLADENPLLAAVVRIGNDFKEGRSFNTAFFAEYLGKALTPVKPGEEEKFFISKGTKVSGTVEDGKLILEGRFGDKTVRTEQVIGDDLIETAVEALENFKGKVEQIPEGKEVAERVEKALDGLPEVERFIEESSPGIELKDGKEILRRLFRNLGHNEELARETLVSLLAGYEPPEALEDSFISSRAVSIAEAVRRTIEEVLEENGIEAKLKTVIEQERFNRAGVLIYDADKRVVLVDEAELEDVSEAYGEVENLASALASIWNRAVGPLETFYGVKVPPVERDTVVECTHEVEEMFGIDDSSLSP